MIRPIQPIGCQPPPFPVYAPVADHRPTQICLSSWLVDSRHLPLGLRLHRLALDTAPPPAFEPAVILEGRLRSQEPIQPLAMPWEPWKEHPPFATESTRWWPSDELPELDEPKVVRVRVMEEPVPPIDWRATGGLISFWA